MSDNQEAFGLPVTSEQIRRLADALANFPSNGKPPSGDTTTMLVLLGFIERREVEKPCRSCGKPQVDYSYFRITGAGRYFLAAAQEQSNA